MRRQEAAAIHFAAEWCADHYGDTFLDLAEQRAEAEGLTVADMTSEDLASRASDIFKEYFIKHDMAGIIEKNLAGMRQQAQ